MLKTKDGRRMLSWINDKVLVKKTEKYGMGIFAKKLIKKNETIIVMGGYVFDIDAENHLNDFNCDKPIEISEYFSISPIKRSDMDLMPQHYVNHSCKPNCGWKGQLFLTAMRAIKPGEEILYDYAMIMHSNEDSKEYFTMACLCGEKNCRKTITEDDWKIPTLQKKYDGYFQWFIQEKIDKKKKKTS
jgi:SET domain-containing protein